MTIDTLIAEARGSDLAVAQRAAGQLVDTGAAAGLKIIAAIEASADAGPDPLVDVLLAMEDSDLVPQLCDSMASERTELSIAAFTLLGRLGDDQAIAPLVDALNDRANVSNASLAASALGEMGRPKAVAPLLAVATSLVDLSDPKASVDRLLDEVVEDWELEPVVLLPQVAIALAQLGCQDLAPIVVRLAGLDPFSYDVDDDEKIELRDALGKSIAALCHVTAPSMVTALQRGASSADPYIRVSALRALFYLGLSESVATLLDCLDDTTQFVRHDALIWFNRITGQSYEPGETKSKVPRAWWKKNAGQFVSGVCHRGGGPITLQAIVDELAEEPNAATDLVGELRIISGKDFVRDRRGKQRNSDWITLVGAWFAGPDVPQLEAGRLYKYGVACDTADLI